jgi:FkbM family methyltransferase
MTVMNRETANCRPQRFRELLPLVDRVRLGVWKLLPAGRTLTVQVDGFRLNLRPLPSRDFDTAYEIFHERIYSLPPMSDVRTVVDVGGNVGMSCLWWAREYPNASIAAWEPHPTHCAIFADHICSNGYSDRVRLRPAAAGISDGTVSLTDDDDASTIGTSFRSARRIEVAMEDLFASAPAGRIDILKMDIEGAEYPILADPRFQQLAARTRYLLLEWHKRTPADLGEQWCMERLRECGFKVQADATSRGGGEFGIIRGVRL